MKNLYHGRFSKGAAELLRQFNDSLDVDCRLFKEDIRGSMAHAKMLGASGIIEAGEADKIVAELAKILAELEAGSLTLPNDEDIHMAIETILTQRLGETGKRLHTARSRNDQVALDMRMYTMTAIDGLIGRTTHLMKVLTAIAKEHLHTAMPGYTHLQPAQPITLAHHLMAWCEMLRRDIGRLDDAKARMNEMPLGAGALAATTYPINRQMVADELGFARITANSMDSVSDRDFAAETIFAISLLMVHLSRMSEEVVLWCSSVFGFAALDDAYATGSSIMPQKKNPDIAELVRGKTGRVAGSLMALLTMLKGLPLAYNKDMQEDKEALFDAIDTADISLAIFAPMLETLTFRKENLAAGCSKGFLNATDAADYLVKKGMAFRDAYTLIGTLVSHCIKENHTIETLDLAYLQGLSPLFEADFFDAVAISACIENRKVPGGPAPAAVAAHIEDVEKFLVKKSAAEL